MGLDIHGKRDYFRFNWSNVTSFKEWNRARGLPDPFPMWNRDEGGDVVDCANIVHRQKVKRWIVAYQKAYPEDAKMGVGESIREIMFYVSAIAKNNAGEDVSYYNPDYLDWNRWTAVAWYFFLKNQLEVNGKIEYS